MKGGPQYMWLWRAFWQPAAVSSSVTISESQVPDKKIKNPSFVSILLCMKKILENKIFRVADDHAQITDPEAAAATAAGLDCRIFGCFGCFCQSFQN
jgi:hypothetical protein